MPVAEMLAKRPKAIILSGGPSSVYADGAPPGFTVTATTEATPVAAMENVRGGLFGVQFHPEVMHTEHGTRILGRFLELAGCRPSWTMLNIVEEQVALIREQVGDGRAIC